jgi:excisionase family DNA binding protein
MQSCCRPRIAQSYLAKAWSSPGASIETRKKIIRLLVKEIIVDVVGGTLVLVIHWQGGDHTQLTVKKNKIGQTRWTVEADLAIAAILNRSGKLTGRGSSWTRTRVCSLRKNNSIPVYREGERAERGEVTLDEAADILKISCVTVYRMVSRGALPAQQLCTGAPWIIRLSDLRQESVRREADARRSRRPISRDPLQNLLPL